MEETISTKETAAAAPPADDVGAIAPSASSPTAEPEPTQPPLLWQTSWFQEQAKTKTEAPFSAANMVERAAVPA